LDLFNILNGTNTGVMTTCMSGYYCLNIAQTDVVQGITQTIPVTAGSIYNVSFLYQNAGTGNQAPIFLNVTATFSGSSPIWQWSVGNPPTGPVYSIVQTLAPASSNYLTITISGIQAGGNVWFVDAVKVIRIGGSTPSSTGSNSATTSATGGPALFLSSALAVALTAGLVALL